MDFNNIRKYQFEVSPVEGEKGYTAFNRFLNSKALERNNKGKVTTMLTNTKFNNMTIILGKVAGFKTCLFINCKFVNSVTTTYKDCVFINPTFINSVHASVFDGNCIFEGICMVKSNEMFGMFDIDTYAPLISGYNLSLKPAQNNKNVLGHTNKSPFSKFKTTTSVRTKKVEAMHIPTVNNFFIDQDTRQIAPRSVSGLARKSMAAGLINRPRQESSAHGQESRAAVNREPSVNSTQPLVITDDNIETIKRQLDSAKDNCANRIKILGFTTDITQNRARFKDIMMKIHPDKHPGNDNYVELTQLVTQTFTDCIKKKQRGGSKKRRAILKARKTRKLKK